MGMLVCSSAFRGARGEGVRGFQESSGTRSGQGGVSKVGELLRRTVTRHILVGWLTAATSGGRRSCCVGEESGVAVVLSWVGLWAVGKAKGRVVA